MSEGKKVSKYALEALEEFEAAAIDLGFIGSARLEDQDEIQARYDAAKKRILKHLAKQPVGANP